MDATITLGYTPGQVQKVNWCPLILQAARLSEIMTLTGNAITTTAWTGLARMPSHHDWPRQGPGPAI
jgi:hypothetical protein